jgi:SnoaL-like polyketide cyclase
MGIVRMRGTILFHHFDLVNRIMKGDHETIEWVFSGTHTGDFGRTGKPFSVHSVTVMDVHGTKLTRETAYWDLARS